MSQPAHEGDINQGFRRVHKWGHCLRRHLVLHVLVAELQLHDVFKGPEERLVKVEVRELHPAGQHLCQNIVDEGNGLLGNVPLFVTRCLEKRFKDCPVTSAKT